MNRLAVIGAVDNYGWPEVSVWARSLRESGFTGPVVLLVYRVHQEKMKTLTEKCKEYDITLVGAIQDWNRGPINHGETGHPTMVNRNRFYHFWEMMTYDKEFSKKAGLYDVDWILHTDVKDVYFQKNPEEFIHVNDLYDYDIVSTSEGVIYEDEPWNYNTDMGANFGPNIQEYMSKHLVYNCGVFLATQRTFPKICLLMFLVSQGRKFGADQASFNILCREANFNVEITDHSNNWTCQCGTVFNDKLNLQDTRPIIDEDGGDITVLSNDAGEFHLVHQYDRHPKLLAYANSRWKE